MNEVKEKLLSMYPTSEAEIDEFMDDLESMDLFMEGVEDVDEWTDDLVHAFETRRRSNGDT